MDGLVDQIGVLVDGGHGGGEAGQLSTPDTTRTEIITARLQSADLAHRLGLEHTGPITRETGTALTDLMRTRPPHFDRPVQTVP